MRLRSAAFVRPYHALAAYVSRAIIYLLAYCLSVCGFVTVVFLHGFFGFAGKTRFVKEKVVKVKY